jgi:hypothetical protein
LALAVVSDLETLGLLLLLQDLMALRLLVHRKIPSDLGHLGLLLALAVVSDLETLGLLMLLQVL